MSEEIIWHESSNYSISREHGGLRYYNGVLQQAIEMIDYDGSGKVIRGHTKWEDVPHVNEDAP